MPPKKRNKTRGNNKRKAKASPATPKAKAPKPTPVPMPVYDATSAEGLAANQVLQVGSDYPGSLLSTSLDPYYPKQQSRNLLTDDSRGLDGGRQLLFPNVPHTDIVWCATGQRVLAELFVSFDKKLLPKQQRVDGRPRSSNKPLCLVVQAKEEDWKNACQENRYMKSAACWSVAKGPVAKNSVYCEGASVMRGWAVNLGTDGIIEQINQEFGKVDKDK